MKMFSHFLLSIVPIMSLAATPPAPPVINQQGVGKNSCGPCAYVNSLIHSQDKERLKTLQGLTPQNKARDFASRFGSAPSVYKYRPETAYSDEDGTTDRDLLAMVNKARAESKASALSGNYVIKGENETPTKFIKRICSRINTSINAGFCPLLDIRGAKATLENDGVMRWNKTAGHWICIVQAQQITDDMLLLKAADSDTGKIISLILYCNEPRKSVVPISFTHDSEGKVKWNWKKSHQCLFVCSPSLMVNRGGVRWFERSYLAACFLIHHNGATPPTNTTPDP